MTRPTTDLPRVVFPHHRNAHAPPAGGFAPPVRLAATAQPLLNRPAPNRRLRFPSGLPQTETDLHARANAICADRRPQLFRREDSRLRPLRTWSLNLRSKFGRPGPFVDSRSTLAEFLQQTLETE